MFLSVVLLSYNQEQFMRDALWSLLAQDYAGDEEWEIVVSDDCSSDGTWDLVNRIAEEYRAGIGPSDLVAPGVGTSRPKLTLRRNEENRRTSGNLQAAIKACAGKYIMKADGDDIGLPWRVSETIRLIKKYPDALLYYFRRSDIDESVRLADLARVTPETVLENDELRHVGGTSVLGKLPAFYGCSGAVNRVLSDSFGDMSRAEYADDTILSYRAYLRNGTIALSGRSTVLYRMHSSNVMNFQAEVSEYERLRKLHTVQMPPLCIAMSDAVAEYTAGRVSYGQADWFLKQIYAELRRNLLFPTVETKNDIPAKVKWFGCILVSRPNLFFKSLPHLLPTSWLALYKRAKEPIKRFFGRFARARR